MIDAALRAISLCSGYGGIELGIRMVRPGLRLVASVERQAYAASVLASRMAEGALDPCPIFDDLESFDGRAFSGRVDLVAAGFPCQGASVAGKRRGTDDARWLWPEVWRITRECGASLLFFENVPGLLTVNGGKAFGAILGDLAARGWAAEWDCVPAAAVGAPHVRDRLFLLAADPNRIAVRIEPEWDQRQGRGERKAERGNAEPVSDGRARDAADPARARSQGGDEREPQLADDGGPREKRNATDADRDRSQGIRNVRQLDEGERQERRHDLDRCNVSPGWSRVVGRSAPEPAIRRVDDGSTGGMDNAAWHERIHLLGNGVVPQAAARAFAHLQNRLS